MTLSIFKRRLRQRAGMCPERDMSTDAHASVTSRRADIHEGEVRIACGR